MGWAPSGIRAGVLAGPSTPLYAVGQCVKSGGDTWKVANVMGQGFTWLYGLNQVNQVSGDVSPFTVYLTEVLIDMAVPCVGGPPPPPPHPPPPPTPRLFADRSCVLIRGTSSPVWLVTGAEWIDAGAWKYFLQIGSDPPLPRLETELVAATCSSPPPPVPGSGISPILLAAGIGGLGLVLFGGKLFGKSKKG